MAFDDPLAFGDPDALLEEVQGIELDLGRPEEPSTRREYPTSLVLAVDVSNSINDEDYRTQRLGTGEALRAIQSELIEMAESGNPAVITYVEFGAGVDGEAVVRIPPTILRDEIDIETLASQIETMERELDPGVTLPSNAMALGRDIHNLVEQEFGPTLRRVTDISADGFGVSSASRTIQERLENPENLEEHGRVLAEREANLLEGVEINSIIMPDYIADAVRAARAGDEQVREMGRSGDGIDQTEIDQLRVERPELFTGPNSSIEQNAGYYDTHVSTGFTIPMGDINDYAEFMERKLRTELIAGSEGGAPEMESGEITSPATEIQEAGIPAITSTVKIG